jgi:hypothetical protein
MVQQQQVLRLDVPVHHITLVMRKCQKLQQLAHHMRSILLAEVALWGTARHSTAQHNKTGQPCCTLQQRPRL